MPLPLPPFTYDDPRLIYDEHCFLYDGEGTGYSDLCLNPPPPEIVRKKGGRSTAYRNTYPPRYDELDVLFKTHLSGVNEVTVDSEERFLRFKDILEKDPRVQIFSIKTETKSKPLQEVEIVVKATPITMGSVPARNERTPSVVIGSQMFIKSQSKQSVVEEAQFLSQSMTFERLNESAFSVKAALIKRETSGSFE
jgi:hypothetical protein